MLCTPQKIATADDEPSLRRLRRLKVTVVAVENAKKALIG
jgi:hypothetical protein